MADTLLLDRGPWDLCMDALGNIAMASAPYSIVQDVASAARLFLGELYYGPPTKGIPYFTDALGQPAPTSILKQKLVDAALTVPGVLSAQVFLTKVEERAIGGQIQVRTAAGPLIVTL
jgi:hypothetical protein